MMNSAAPSVTKQPYLGTALLTPAGEGSRKGVPKHAGYTFMWSGCADSERNTYGVVIAVKTSLLNKGLISQPTCMNDRLMSCEINGNNTRTTFICCYAPTLKDEVNKKEAFYENLRDIMDRIPKKNEVVIAGDMNARVGTSDGIWDDIIGRHGLGKRNGNGLLLLEFCMRYNLRIANTNIQQKNMNKTTWMHPREKNGTSLITS